MINPLLNNSQKTRYEDPFFNVDDYFLADQLIKNVSIDPYMQSLTYMKMTSRKGLRAFKGKNSDVFFSMHPNCNDTYIIYPLNIKNAATDILDLANILKQTGKKVELIRLNHIDVKYITAIEEVSPHKEHILDYTYPVHIVDTSAVTDMKGVKFSNFRTTINAILKTNIEVKDLTFTSEEKFQLKQVSKEWGGLRFGEEASENILFMYYAIDNLLDLPEMKGCMAYNNGKPSGFMLWELPLKGKNIANCMVHCTLHERGLSELLHHQMCNSLYKEKISYLCLGGAETEGLDFFKRKMNPINSIELVTITL